MMATALAASKEGFEPDAVTAGDCACSPRIQEKTAVQWGVSENSFKIVPIGGLTEFSPIWKAARIREGAAQ